MPKLIYVAGPYRGPAPSYIESNIASARHVGMLCARKGWYPVIPHNNTARFDLDFPNLQSDQFWLAGTLELMRKCDAVLLQRAKNIRNELSARGVGEQTIRKRVQADRWVMYRGFQVKVQ